MESRIFKTYNNKSDLELLKLIPEDKEALNCLIERYYKVVSILAYNSFLPGNDKEDLIQEGIIALMLSIKAFDPSYDVQFRTFAELCIRRGMWSAITKSNRLKHVPLNKSISFEVNNATNNIYANSIPSFSNNPADIIIEEEEYYGLLKSIKDLLSYREKQVLEYFHMGYSYYEISNILGIKVKSVDTALSRARRKIKNFEFSK